MKFPLYLVCMILLLSCQPVESPNNNSIADFEAYLEEEIAVQEIPALSVLVFKGEHVLYERCWGVAQIQENTPLTKEHPFLLASISKVVTATALLQLHEDGKFALDDPINDYLPFRVDIPGWNEVVTFEMLLTHRASIDDGAALNTQYYDGEDSPIALKDFLQAYFTPNGTHYDAIDNFYAQRPGSTFRYTNTGSALIGLLVEEISGMNFNSYCKQHIFNPLSMNHTAWRLDEIAGTIVEPCELENGKIQAYPHYTFTDYPNGGLRSTAADLHQLLKAFTQDGTVNGYELLKATTIQEMASTKVNTSEGDLGWQLFEMNAEYKLWGHDGSEKGSSTIMAFNATTKVGAIILTNQGNVELDELLVEAYLLGLDL